MDHFYSRKFIEEIQSSFNIEEHYFIILQKKNHKSYINLEKHQNITIFKISREKKVFEFVISHIKLFTKEFSIIRRFMKQAENILIHNLTEEFSVFLYGFKGKAKISWIIWGVDLYDYIPLNLYDQFTSKLEKKLNNFFLLFLIKLYYSFFYALRKRILRRIDYVISAHRGDLKLFIKYYRTNAKCLFENIYPNPIDFKKIEKNRIINKNFTYKESGIKLILIGNSGGPTNNHLDLMIRLSKIKIQNFKIICPLSYGPSSYIQVVVENGYRIFGDRFIPLLDFLEEDIYYQILKQIDLAIMYHNRQQAIGNIQLLVLLGKVLCMKKTSIFFQLLDSGVNVFSSKDLEKLLSDEIVFNEDMAKNNKDIAIKLFSVESARKSIENILNVLNS